LLRGIQQGIQQAIQQAIQKNSHLRRGVMRERIAHLLLSVVCAGLLAACDTGPKSSIGFRLPDGDAAAGQELFVELQCNSCHRIADMEMDPPAEPGPVLITLGGPVVRVQTYGQLVSSVINPSHRISRRFSDQQVSKDGESVMRVYNETMTVQQLIDIVAFLQVQYKVAIPEYAYY
jgi:sulfur-oxidizing protein SoxX